MPKWLCWAPLLASMALVGCGSIPQYSAERCYDGQPGCLTFRVTDVRMDTSVPILAQAAATPLASHQVVDAVKVPGSSMGALPRYTDSVSGIACVYEPGPGIKRVSFYDDSRALGLWGASPALVDTSICPQGPVVGKAIYALEMRRRGGRSSLTIPHSLVAQGTTLMFCVPNVSTVVPGTDRGNAVTSAMFHYYLAQRLNPVDVVFVFP